MSLPLRIHPEAEAEFAEAVRWYEPRGTDLASDFIAAVDEAITALRRHPDRYPVVRGATRRFLVRRFPYGVFYIPGPKELRVTAIYHLARDPRGWQSRS